MSQKNYDEPILNEFDEIEEVVEEQAEKVEEAVPVFGVVTDCLKLNIRTSPDKNAEVVAIVECLDEVEIDLDASTDDWYAICTVSGIKGFCMKKFIAVKH